jgi:hypothetical protein
VAAGRTFVAAHRIEDGVEALVAFLSLLAVPLDPLRHQVEDLRLEVARPPLGVLALADQRATMSRLVGSARAANTRDSRSSSTDDPLVQLDG